MKRICLLGSTGSIGINTLDIIERNSSRFEVVAVSCNSKIDLMEKILNRFSSIKYACVCKGLTKEFVNRFPHITFFEKEEGLIELIKASSPDMVVNALVGFVGLLPSIYTIENDIDLALANKESLVIGGELINNLLKEHKGKMYPIDSEHVALAKLLKNRNINDVDSLIITASGGSFRDLSREELVDVTVNDALNHPSWSMGDKITIDSATMVNKAFEIIEAYHLFGFSKDKIKVLLHDESYIHSLILMNDHSYIADIGPRDMAIPISYALNEGNYYKDEKLPKLNLEDVMSLHFRKLDLNRYPAIKFAYKVIEEKGTLGAVFNAANEACNLYFRKGLLPFNRIEEIIEEQMNAHRIIDNPSLEDLLYVHDVTFKAVEKYIKEGK